MIAQLQQQIPPRSLAMILVSVWLLTLLAAYLYLFKNPLAAYLEERSVLQRLGTTPASPASLNPEIQALQKEIDAYRKQLNQDGTTLSANLMVAQVIGKLDQIAKQQSARLIGVEPGKPLSVLIFEELPFRIEVEGTYFSLYQWLQAVERDLQPMVVKKFEIRRGQSDRQRKMLLTLASYRMNI